MLETLVSFTPCNIFIQSQKKSCKQRQTHEKSDERENIYHFQCRYSKSSHFVFFCLLFFFFFRTMLFLNSVQVFVVRTTKRRSNARCSKLSSVLLLVTFLFNRKKKVANKGKRTKKVTNEKTFIISNAVTANPRILFFFVFCFFFLFFFVSEQCFHQILFRSSWFAPPNEEVMQDARNSRQFYSL
jgi:hypothetical protein